MIELSAREVAALVRLYDRLPESLMEEMMVGSDDPQMQDALAVLHRLYQWHKTNFEL